MSQQNQERQQKRVLPNGPGIIQEKSTEIIPKRVNAPKLAAKPPKRFNEMDISILEETAGLEVEEAALKLEIRMNQISKQIELINDQIELYSIIQPKDKYDKFRELLIRKDESEQELEIVKAKYHSLGEFYRISDKLSDAVEKTFCSIKKQKSFFTRSKFCQWSFGFIPFLRSRSYLLGTLDKLNALYKKMENIVNMKHVPYGEKEDTINDLVDFMRTANRLESRIQTFFLVKKTENK